MQLCCPSSREKKFQSVASFAVFTLSFPAMLCALEWKLNSFIATGFLLHTFFYLNAVYRM